GGLGTRLRGVVRDRPKGLIEIHGRPFLEWLVLRLLNLDQVLHIVLATGHSGQKIEDHFGHRPWCGANISYSHEDVPLGTAGALRLAVPLTSAARVLVLNGDSY